MNIRQTLAYICEGRFLNLYLVFLFNIRVGQQGRLSFNCSRVFCPKYYNGSFEQSSTIGNLKTCDILCIICETHGIEWFSAVENIISEKCNDCSFQNDCKLVYAQIKDQFLVLIKWCKILRFQFSIKWQFSSTADQTKK